MITPSDAVQLVVAVRQSGGGFRLGRHGRPIVVGRRVPKRLREAVRRHDRAVGVALTQLLDAPPPCPSVVLARVDQYLAAGRTLDTGWVCALADFGFARFVDLVQASRTKLLETLDASPDAMGPAAPVTRAVIDHAMFDQAVAAGWPMARLFGTAITNDPAHWGFIRRLTTIDPDRQVTEIVIRRDGAVVTIDDSTHELWPCAVPASAPLWWLANSPTPGASP